MKILEDYKDRTKIKSKLFFVSNIYRDNEGKLKYIELKPFNNNLIDYIFIYSNSVFYSKNISIDEIKNISTYSNIELVNVIEDRLNNLAYRNF